jgi:hypothetical protein
LNGLNDRASAQVIEFAGFWTSGSCLLANSILRKSRAVILLARADGAGNLASERRESGKQDLFRSRLDQIIDMNHALVKLARAIDWRFLVRGGTQLSPRQAGPIKNHRSWPSRGSRLVTTGK